MTYGALFILYKVRLLQERHNPNKIQKYFKFNLTYLVCVVHINYEDFIKR